MIEQPDWTPSLSGRQLALLGGGFLALVFLFLVAPTLAVPLALALLVAAVAWWLLGLRRRRRRLRAVAAERGLDFRERDDGVLRRFPHAPFAAGRRQAATNVLEGRAGGRRLLACELRMLVAAFGDPQMLVHYAVVAVGLERPLPLLTVRPLPRPLLGPDPFAADFARAFRLDPDDVQAEALLGAELRRFLLAEGREISWQTDGLTLVGWTGGRLDQRKLDRQQAFLTKLAELLDGAAGRA